MAALPVRLDAQPQRAVTQVQPRHRQALLVPHDDLRHEAGQDRRQHQPPERLRRRLGTPVGARDAVGQSACSRPARAPSHQLLEVLGLDESAVQSVVERAHEGVGA